MLESGQSPLFIQRLRVIIPSAEDNWLWSVARTHPSSQKDTAARDLHSCLADLGKVGCTMQLAFCRTLSDKPASSADLTAQLSNFDRDPTWVDLAVDRGFLAETRFGRGLDPTMLSLQVRKNLAYAAIGAAFIFDTVRTRALISDVIGSCFLSCRSKGVSDEKQILQAYSQRVWGTAPEYTVIEQAGTQHEPAFKVRAAIPRSGHESTGRGTTKKSAERAAAASLLGLMGVSPAAYGQDLQSSHGRNGALQKIFHIRGQGTAGRLSSLPQHFLKSFHELTGVEIPESVVELCLRHASMRQQAEALAADFGLPALGSRSFLFVLLRKSLKAMSETGNVQGDACDKVRNVMRICGTNDVKVEFADQWKRFISYNPRSVRSIPAPVLSDSFDSLLGSLLLLQDDNLMASERFATAATQARVDWHSLSGRSSFIDDCGVSARPELQQLRYLFMGPEHGNVPDSLYLFGETGPAHERTYCCSLDGDREGRFRSASVSKKLAREGVSKAVVCFVCSAIEQGVAPPTGVPWVDTLASNAVHQLLVEPTLRAWNIQFYKYPFKDPGWWTDLAGLVLSATQESASKARHVIQLAAGLRDVHRNSLLAFLDLRRHEQDEIIAVRNIQRLFRGFPEDVSNDAPRVIATLVVALQLISLVEGHRCADSRWPEIVRAIAVGCAVSSPEVVKVQQRVSSVSLSAVESICRIVDEYKSSVGDHACAMSISFNRDRMTVNVLLSPALASVAAEALLAARETWDSVRFGVGLAVYGETVEFTLEGSEWSDVSCVRPDACCSQDAAVLPRSIMLSEEFIAIRSGLHDLKNRIISYSPGWSGEFNIVRRSVTAAFEHLRNPEPCKTDLGGLVQGICRLCENVSRGSHRFVECDVRASGSSGYVDLPMLLSCIENLCGNAASAASESESGKWGIVGDISDQTLELVIWNDCSDGREAISKVQSAEGRTAKPGGTGLGLKNVVHGVARMLGLLTFELDAGRVCAHLSIPTAASDVFF